MISANVVEELYGAGWIRDDVQVILCQFNVMIWQLNPKHDDRLDCKRELFISFSMLHTFWAD